MSITCRDLLTLHCFRSIQLLAGESGLDRMVTWPYISQTPDIRQWVHGGELVFVTGMDASYTEPLLCTLLEDCICNAVCGIVFLCNPQYIPSIPPVLTARAEDADLPLFQMPWDLKLVDVTREIANYIVMTQFQQQNVTAFFFDLLHTDTQNSAILERAAQSCGISLQRPALFTLFTIQTEDNDYIGNLISLLHDTISRLLHSCCADAVTTISTGIILCCVFPYESSPDTLYRICREQLSHLLAQIPRGRICGGFGQIFSGSDGIRRSYEEAARALEFAQKSSLSLAIMRYDDIGFLNFFLDSKRQPMVLDYCRSLLHPLAEADRLHGSSLLETLYSYLDHSCSLVPTAQALYIHRNTLVYRMERIRILLSTDLSDLFSQSEYYTALRLVRHLGWIDQL